MGPDAGLETGPALGGTNVTFRPGSGVASGGKAVAGALVGWPTELPVGLKRGTKDGPSPSSISVGGEGRKMSVGGMLPGAMAGGVAFGAQLQGNYEDTSKVPQEMGVPRVVGTQ